VTGASDDDPSGIATYAQSGAKAGFGMLWAALITLPLMAGVQEICDRTALASGQGIGELITRKFESGWRIVIGVLLGALIVANALNIAADLVAIGSGAHLLHAGSTWAWALIAGVAVICLVTTGSFELIARIFKLLCVALLAYIGVLVAVHVSWSSVARHTFVPHVSFTRDYLALLAGVLGTTISPYLFFWQSAHRLEEMRDEPEGGPEHAEALGDRSRRQARLKQRTSRLDVFTGMAFSNLVMFSIIVATAVTLGAHGKHDIQGAAQAAAALRPVAGRSASILFALGFIGSGMLAVPVLAGAGSAGMAGLLGKPSGFSRSVKEAPVFYGLVVVGTLTGMVLTLLGINPLHLLVFVAIVNGVAAAPFLVVVMLVSADRSIMGEYVNGRLAHWLGWVTVALMTAAAVGVLITA
jgi:NRAMP (natural resistance-associated macrophage protein)-like metal ion transporter